MEPKLQLTVFLLLAQVSLALWQRVTVLEGDTIHLSCPVTDAHQTNVDWKNPEGFVMFFNRKRALRDPRYRIDTLSKSEFSVSIASATLKDGGNYTCTQYGTPISEKTVEVTVVGRPKMSVARHGHQTVIKCTAGANGHHPNITWKLGKALKEQGLEIVGHPQSHREDKKYISVDLLHVQSVVRRVTVKCLVRHPDWHFGPLLHYVTIGPKRRHTTTTASPTARPLELTTGWSRHGSTMLYLTTRDINRPSSESSTHTFPVSPDTSTTNPNTTGWTPETTEWAGHYNRTETNVTGSINDRGRQTGGGGSSSLLVFLVTCLIFGLLVVVSFFAIKLRRAHLAWKRENEDSNPSEESSKSKSSQEERNAHGQRRRGHLNTAFTQYVSEKPKVMTSAINTGAIASPNSVNAVTSHPQSLSQPPAKTEIKETEL